MTQEEKQLLLTDLCARLPYGVKFKIGDYSDYNLIGIVISDEHPIKVEVIEKGVPYKIEVSLDIIKPYLRPMSSMTEEEKIDYQAFFNYDGVEYPEEYIDWLNKKMFDYRGLIEKGLAIEANGGMYNNKEEQQ